MQQRMLEPQSVPVCSVPMNERCSMEKAEPRISDDRHRRHPSQVTGEEILTVPTTNVRSAAAAACWLLPSAHPVSTASAGVGG